MSDISPCIALAATIITPSITLLGGVISWLLNERVKRKHHIYIKKLNLYESLIRSVKGFYVKSVSAESKQAFLDDLAVANIYASSEVIDKAYEFLDKVKVGVSYSDEKKEESLNRFICAIRKDMELKLPKTPFKPLSVNYP